MLVIKIKIYDEAGSTKTQEAVDIINEYVGGEDITSPWNMFNFVVETNVLGVDFITDDMESLFPGHSWMPEYPQISIEQGDDGPNAESKFLLSELHNAIRNLCKFIS